VDVDTQNLLNKFHEGFRDYDIIWEQVLTEDVYKKLREIRGLEETEFNFPTDLWARLLFDVGVSYRFSDMDRDLMMESLIPLYFGRTLSFVRKTRKMTIKQAEEAIEEDSMTFEMTKPYLVKRWKEMKASTD
jgi:hypothetical protein